MATSTPSADVPDINPATRRLSLDPSFAIELPMGSPIQAEDYTRRPTCQEGSPNTILRVWEGLPPAKKSRWGPEPKLNRAGRERVKLT